MNGQLLDGLYWSEKLDDGSQPNYLCPFGNDTAGVCPVSPSDKIIFYGNFMLGVPRWVLDEACLKQRGRSIYLERAR